MKILFFTKFFVHDNFGRDPLGILYLSSALKAAGHEVDIADASDHREAMKVFSEFDPDVAGFSITTSTYGDYVDINNELKRRKPGLYSLFGGPHCTFHPEFFHDIDSIDAICLGEGEEAIVDFLARKASGARYEDTPNFHVRINGTIVRNEVRPYIADIDTIGYPDRELLRRYPFVRTFPVKTFITTRGCPYDCTYCYNFALAELYKGKGPRVRFRSVENVLGEMESELTKGPIDFINFDDDIFGINVSWLEEFAAKYPRRIGLPYCCNIRVEHVKEKTVKLLKESGCHTCVMGIESGNRDVRKDLLERDMTDGQIIAACHLIRNEGILLEAENIMGLPGVSYEQEKETVRLNIECRPDYPASYIFQPQPKTVLGRRAIEEKLFDGDFSKMSNYYRTSVLNTKGGKRLERLRSLFFFIVRFPFLYRFTDLLVSLPFANVYYIFHAVARGYMARFRIMPYRFKVRDFFYHLYRYLLCG